MKLKDDIKGTWKTINGILSKSKTKHQFPKNLKSDIKEDPNNTYNIWHSVVQDAKNIHMPTKLINIINTNMRNLNESLLA